jgi:hypothetical protein
VTLEQLQKAPKLLDEFGKILNMDTMQIVLGAMREAVIADIPNFSKENLEGYARYHQRLVSLAKSTSFDVPDDFNPEN